MSTLHDGPRDARGLPFRGPTQDRDRLAALQTLTAALARARTLEDVAAVIIDRALPTLEAIVGVVAILSEDGRTLRNVGFEGVDDSTRAEWAEYPVTAPVPVAECGACGETILVRTIAERNARYPVLAEVHGLEHGGAVIALPMMLAGRQLGVLGLCFEGSRDFDEHDLAFLQTLADQCALAVDRAQIEARMRDAVAVRERSEAMLRLALSAARVVAWEVDLRSDHVVCSDTARDVFGFVEATREAFHAALDPRDRDAFRAAIGRAVAHDERISLEMRVTRVDGATRWMHAVAELQRDAAGAPARLVGVSYDVTERREAQERLRDEARRKDDFIAMLAHELRNPLAAVRSASGLLRARPADASIVRRAGDVVERQSAHMSRMVSDLLDAASGARGLLELRRARVDLRGLVRAAADDQRTSIEGADRRFEVAVPDAPVECDADEPRIAQAVSNLLDNALKFTAPGGRIRLALGVGPGSATIEVEDDGVGIDPADLERVFEPLWQAPGLAIDRSRGGLGLGLSLARTIVELHGGRLTAESEGEGRGTRMTIALPARPP